MDQRGVLWTNVCRGGCGVTDRLGRQRTRGVRGSTGCREKVSGSGLEKEGIMDSGRSCCPSLVSLL